MRPIVLSLLLALALIACQSSPDKEKKAPEPNTKPDAEKTEAAHANEPGEEPVEPDTKTAPAEPQKNDAAEKDSEKTSPQAEEALDNGLIPLRARPLLARGQGLLVVRDFQGLAEQILGHFPGQSLDGLKTDLGEQWLLFQAIFDAATPGQAIYLSLPEPHLEPAPDHLGATFSFSMALSIPTEDPKQAKTALAGALTKMGGTPAQGQLSCQNQDADACLWMQAPIFDLTSHLLILPGEHELVVLAILWPAGPLPSTVVEDTSARMESRLEEHKAAFKPTLSPALEALFQPENQVGLLINYQALATLFSAIGAVEANAAIEWVRPERLHAALGMGFSYALHFHELAHEGLEFEASAILWREGDALSLVHDLSGVGRAIYDGLGDEEPYLPALAADTQIWVDLTFSGDLRAGLDQAPTLSWKPTPGKINKLFRMSGNLALPLAFAQPLVLLGQVDQFLKKEVIPLPAISSARFIMTDTEEFALALVFEDEAAREAFSKHFNDEMPVPGKSLDQALAPTLVFSNLDAPFVSEKSQGHALLELNLDTQALALAFGEPLPPHQIQLRRRHFKAAVVDEIILDRQAWPMQAPQFSNTTSPAPLKADGPFGCAAQRTQSLSEFFSFMAYVVPEKQAATIQEFKASEGHYSGVAELEKCAKADPKLHARLAFEDSLFETLVRLPEAPEEVQKLPIYPEEEPVEEAQNEPPEAAVRTADLGQDSGNGALPKSAIQKVVKANIQQIQACYETQLAKKPSLAGKVIIQWIIDEEGAVTTAVTTDSTLNSSATEDCLVQLVSKWRFPKPDGGTVVVKYPFIFSPAE